MALDIYQAVTDRILELLDQGTVPWRQPFKRGSGGESGMPKNLISDKEYRGINVFLLAVTAMLEGYDSPYWLTFKQAKDRGGHVRKDERGSLVIFWAQREMEDKITGEPVHVPVMRYYTLFNAQQCEGLELPTAPKTDAEPDTQETPFEPIVEAMAIVDGYEGAPRIEHHAGRAFYRPSEDLVSLPEPREFIDGESYYATLFHELVHSTGHSKRLDRGIDTKTAPFGSNDYSKEELVAEMGAAFLAAVSGISPPTIEQSAAYIESWRKKLKGDKKLVVQAAGAGQKAVDWVLGVHHKPQERVHA
jgi:antirestriction protein ArdC